MIKQNTSWWFPPIWKLVKWKSCPSRGEHFFLSCHHWEQHFVEKTHLHHLCCPTVGTEQTKNEFGPIATWHWPRNTCPEENGNKNWGNSILNSWTSCKYGCISIWRCPKNHPTSLSYTPRKKKSNMLHHQLHHHPSSSTSSQHIINIINFIIHHYQRHHHPSLSSSNSLNPG